LEKIKYTETCRRRRALLDFARDFSTPQREEDVVAALIERVQTGLHVVPIRLFRIDREPTPESELLRQRLEKEQIWRLRGAAVFAAGATPVDARLHEAGFRTFFAMRCAGQLVAALGVGYKDGRVPLSSEDESLLTALMAQAGLAYENARLYGTLAERLEEIRTLQQYQESVIRSSSSGIVVLDDAGRVHSANPAFSALIGRPEKEMLELSFDEVLRGVTLPEPEPAGESEQTAEFRFTNAPAHEPD